MQTLADSSTELKWDSVTSVPNGTLMAWSQRSDNPFERCCVRDSRIATVTTQRQIIQYLHDKIGSYAQYLH